MINTCPSSLNSARAKPPKDPMVMLDHLDQADKTATLEHQAVLAIKARMVIMVHVVRQEAMAAQATGANQDPMDRSAMVMEDQMVRKAGQDLKAQLDHQEITVKGAKMVTMDDQVMLAAQDVQEAQDNPVARAIREHQASQDQKALATTAHQLVWHQATKSQYHISSDIIIFVCLLLLRS